MLIGRGGAVLIAFIAGILARTPAGKILSLSEPSTSEGQRIAAGSPRGSDGTFQSIAMTPATPVAQAPAPHSQTPVAMVAFARETLAEPNTIKRYAALAGLLENVTPENWERVLKVFGEQTKENGRLHFQEWQMYLQRAGEVAGEPVAELMYEENRKEGIRAALTGWAITDPEAAVDWLETVPDPAFRDSVWGAAVRGVAMSDPDLSLRLLEQIPVDDRGPYTDNLMHIIIQTAGVEDASDVFDQAVRRAGTNGELEGGYLKKIFSPLTGRRLRHSDFSGTEEWSRKHIGQPYAHDWFYFKAAENIARENPDAAITFLEDSHAAGFEGSGFGAVVTGWMESQGPDAIGEWLNANPDHPHRDVLAAKFATKIIDQDPEAAEAWFNSIEDPAIAGEISRRFQDDSNDPFAP